MCIILQMVSRIDPDNLYRGNSYFLRIVYEISSPPSKSAVCNNGVLATRHQLHISVTVFTFVPIDKQNLVFRKVQRKNPFILFTPFNTTRISKEHKYWIFDMLFYVPDRPTEVAIFVTVAIAP